MRLLLPKPRRDWERWQAGLEATGIQLELVDPWQFEWLPETPWQRTQWLNLDEYQGVVCVSARAAEGLVHALDRYWPMPPVRVSWLCNGSGTAQLLQEAELKAGFPERDNTAEAVLQMPETLDVTDQKWMVIKGEGGRDTFAQTLSQRGAAVTEMVLYRRALDPQAMESLHQRSKETDVLLVSSQTLAEGLWRHAPAHWHQWPGEWLVSSDRLLAWAQHQGVPHCRSTNGAALENVRRTLLEMTQGG